MPTPAPTSASIDVGTVRQRFNYDWTTDPDSFPEADTYWWWARSIRVDPNEIIADDDEGNLWSIPFSTDGADAVTFGTPVRVRETYVPVSDGDGAAATAVVSRRRQRTVAAGLTRPDKPAHPDHPSASTGPRGQEEQTMPDMTALRAEYGIADDVTDDDIRDVLATLGQPATDEDLDTGDTDPDTTVEETGEPTGDLGPAAASPVEAENAALRATVERLAAQEQARASREEAATREQVLSDAVREGRITPHERTSVWEPFYDADAAAATARLQTLPTNRVPVTERGHAAGADAAAATDYPSQWLSPSERAAVAARKES